MSVRNIKPIILILACVFAAIGIYANANLYFSFGSTIPSKISYVSLGIAFDIFKLVALVTAMVLWRYGFNITAAIVAGFWLILTGISLSAFFGYTVNVIDRSEQERIVNSLPYQHARAELETVEQQLSSATQYATADITELEHNVSFLKSQVSQAKAALDACPNDYITHCIKPKTAELRDAQSEYALAVGELNKVQRYHGLLKQKELALSSMSSYAKSDGVTTVSDSAMNPLFIEAARLLDMQPGDFKRNFLATSALCCELLASLSFYVFALLTGIGRDWTDWSTTDADADDDRRTIGFMPTTQSLPVAAKKKEESEPPHNTQSEPTQSEPNAPNALRNNTLRNDTHTHMHGNCQQCGSTYKKKTTWQKYCCPDCRARANGYADEQAVKQAMSQKRGKKKQAA